MVAVPALATEPNSTSGRNEVSLPDRDRVESTEDDDGPSYVGPEFRENSSIDLILNATERLGDLEIENETAATAMNDTVAAINASMQAYRRTRYIDSREGFDSLAEAQRSLAELRAAVDEDDEAIVDEISRELYTAAATSGRLTVGDAAAMVTVHDAELRGTNQHSKAVNGIGGAYVALEQANRSIAGINSSTGEPTAAVGPTDRASAIGYVESAWVNAQGVLDAVEAVTEPSLSLSHGQPFERNGTIQVPLEATLSDIRPYAYENATVTVDGDDGTDSLPFVSNESAGSSASGTTLVDLGAEPGNVTVAVTATPGHDSNRTVEASREIRVTEDDIRWDRPEPDEHRDIEVSNESTDVAVDVEGDGLHEADVSITNETPATDDEYRVGPTVRIVTETSFDRAEITLPVDEKELEQREGNVSIYTWDPTSNESWTALETEIDRENGTATAEVDHFSYFSVFDHERWTETTNDVITLEDRHVEGDPDDLPSSWIPPGDERDGTVYVGINTSLHAIDAATGATEWEFETPRPIGSSPTVVDGTVYVGSSDGSMYAVNARTGEQEWRFDSRGPISASPTVVDGSVFFGNRDHSLYAIDSETGEEEWEYKTSSNVTTASTVVDGTVYTSIGSAVVAVDATTGDEVWEYDTDSYEIPASPTVWNDTVYAGESARHNDSIYAIDSKTGETRWRSEIDLSVGERSSPTVANGIVFIGGSSGRLHAFDAATGDSAGDFQTGDGNPMPTGTDEGEISRPVGIKSSPTVADGTVYVGGGRHEKSGSLYAIDAVTMEQEWEYRLPDGKDIGYSSPTVANGVVYFGSEEHFYENGYPNSTGSVLAVDAESGERLWERDSDRAVFSSPTVVLAGDDRSSDSRVRLGTLGHHDGWDGEDSASAHLRDTSGDGIPDAVAEMDLGMPTGGPGVVGTPLNLDPTTVDTSGDGIPDSETVDISYRVITDDGETKLEAEVTDAAHHPARIDTTGDGVTDAEQLEGWEIEVVDEPTEAQDLMELVTDPDTDGDPAVFFSSREVDADPLIDDTDGDGLADEEERDLGTDPERSDTTGDGISDADAFDDPEEDPTVFSTSPPEMTLVDYRKWSEPPSVDFELGLDPIDVDGPSWHFQYVVQFHDPGGVSEYEITRGDRTIGEGTLSNEPVMATRTETLESLTEGVFTSWRGSQATAKATDGHGNDGAERIHSESSFYGTVIGTNVDPHAGGTLSGFTHSAAELPELIAVIGAALWDDPKAAGNELVELVGEIDRELLAELLPMVIESTQDQQQLDNPYSEGTIEHERYAEGWYEGYTLHFLSSIAYGGTITKGATKGANVGSRLSRVSDDLPTASRAIRADGSGLKSARIANRLADQGYDGLAQKFRTAGKEAQTVKTLDEVDTAVLRSLDETQRTELLQHIADHPNGARLVDDLGPQRTDELFSLSVRQTDNVQLRENLFRLHRQGVPSDEIDRFARNVDKLEGTSGLHRSIETTVNGGNPSNFRGDLFETEVAVRKGSDNVKEMGKSIPGGEVDIVMENRLVETKSGSYQAVTNQDRQYQQLASQIATYQRYADESDVIEVAFRAKPSDDVRSLLDNNGIEYTY
ncbi:outer membrane protein assembly factor BamB family protein [Natrinema salaciae]|nr:PQQ-binding-like beta-propeller repeat protein [Natrinema salaciae]